jgi:hypothetical protein
MNDPNSVGGILNAVPFHHNHSDYQALRRNPIVVGRWDVGVRIRLRVRIPRRVDEYCNTGLWFQPSWVKRSPLSGNTVKIRY